MRGPRTRFMALSRDGLRPDKLEAVSWFRVAPEGPDRAYGGHHEHRSACVFANMKLLVRGGGRDRIAGHDRLSAREVHRKAARSSWSLKAPPKVAEPEQERAGCEVDRKVAEHPILAHRLAETLGAGSLSGCESPSPGGHKHLLKSSPARALLEVKRRPHGRVTQAGTVPSK